jgi:hypothetical protein
VNFKIPIATLFAAAIFDGLAQLDDKAAIGLSIVVLIGAFTAKFGGKSVAETLAGIFSNVDKGTQSKTTTKKAA